MKRTKTIAFAFAGSLLASSAGACVGDDAATDPTQHVDLRDFDGTDLFRGVVLGYGPVAELVPEINDYVGIATETLSDEQRASIEADYDELIAAMDELDPAYFVEFEAAVRSGDRQRLVQAIQEARELMATATAAAQGEIIAAGHDHAQRSSTAIQLGGALALWLVVESAAVVFVPPPTTFVLPEYIVLPNPPFLAASVGLAKDANGGLLEERIIDAVVSMASEADPSNG